jgi:hypothetical protein
VVGVVFFVALVVPRGKGGGGGCVVGEVGHVVCGCGGDCLLRGFVG